MFCLLWICFRDFPIEGLGFCLLEEETLTICCKEMSLWLEIDCCNNKWMLLERVPGLFFTLGAIFMPEATGVGLMETNIFDPLLPPGFLVQDWDFGLGFPYEVLM